MRSRPLLLAGSIAALLLMAAAVIGLLTRDQRRSERSDERQRLALVTTVLRETVLDDIGQAEAVAGLFDASHRVDAPEFAAFAGRVLHRRSALDAILYASADPADRTPIVYAATRAVSAIPGPPGTDLAADPAREEAIRLARDTGVPQASRPVSVLGGTGRAVAVFTPIYGPRGPPATVAARRRAIRGYAVAVLRIDALEARLREALPGGLRFAVTDRETASPLVTVDPGPRAASGTLAVAGRRWDVSVAAADEGIPPLAYGVGIGAVALAALIIALHLTDRGPRTASGGRSWRAAMVRLRRGV